jgi:hypothetical protein
MSAVQALPGSVNELGQIGNWVGVVVLLLLVVMNMSNIDSVQNGLASTISSHLFKNSPHSLFYTRLLVIIVIVPVIGVATQNYAILEASAACAPTMHNVFPMLPRWGCCRAMSCLGT